LFVAIEKCIKFYGELIEGVQHRATRMVPGLAKLTYEERLQTMDLPSRAYRRVRWDAIEIGEKKFTTELL